MKQDEGLTVKLWLEQHHDQPNLYHSIKSNLNKADIKALNTLLNKTGLTWPAMLHGAWGLLLNHFSSADYITFGSGLLNSTRSNTIKIHPKITPVNAVLNDKISLKMYINKIKSQLSKKSTHKLQTPDEMRYLLLIHQSDNKKTSGKSITLDPITYPLVLIANKKNPDTLTIFYTTLFSSASIKSILEHLEIIIRDMIEDVSQKACTINLLTPQENKKILHEWNKPTYPFSLPKLTQCYHDLFIQHANKLPDKVAISHNNIEISYSLLNEASSWLANNLLESGVWPGDRICVLMERSSTLLMTMLGVAKAGAVYVPINPKYPSERIQFVLQDSQAKIIITNHLNALPENYRERAIVIDATWENLSYTKTQSPIPLPYVDTGQVAYIIYTSGTTGTPKGVMIRHESLTNLIAWYQGGFKVTPQSRASQFASQGFDTFLCETVPYLASGASIHIVDDHIKLSPSLFFSWLEKNKITICDLPTSYAQILFTLNWPDNLSLKLVKIGGENVTHHAPHRLPFDIWNGYGPTETTIEATFYQFYHANTEPNPELKHSHPPIGKPIANYEAYIVDKYLQPVPIGVGGELLIGGPGVANGYLNRYELTEQRFIPHIFERNSSKKLYKTGDLAKWNKDGNIEYIGRIDHQVKIRGYRIELGEIESTIHEYPDVNEAVVLVKEGLNGDKSLIAYVVPDLESARYLYQTRCILTLGNDEYLEALTEDISKNGVAITGITTDLKIGHAIEIHFKLPGMTEGKTLKGFVIWQHGNRAGIVFDLNDDDRATVDRSIEYYLSIHNVMELVLSAAAKRNLRRALKKKLPEYMIPSVFVTLMQMPLTFTGKVDFKALPPPHDFEKTLQKNYVEPKTETEISLTKIWEDLLHKPHISMTDNFFDLGGNSLSTAELSVIILNQFNITIPAKLLFDLPYIPILAQYIDSNGRSYLSQTVVQEEIQRDCQLHENIVPTKELTPNLSNPKNILLTGAGGFLGVFILAQLIKHTDAKIYCLIRCGEFETAAKRLMSTIEKFNLSNEISLSDRRIIAIASDISFDHFGLPLEHYNSLVSKIDEIYHCGAQVNIMASYNKLRASNVEGTLEIIKFATKYINKPIHYISTLSSAYKKDADGRLIEVFPDGTYEGLFGGYAITKWVSEYLLTQAKERGLPVSLYRSGYIFGDSRTGVTSHNDALLMLIKGCIQLGYAPDMKERITILPVDFVSLAIVKIARLTAGKSGVYHIDHPTGIMWPDFVSWLNIYGYKIKIISVEDWLNKLIKISQDNALYPFIPYYLAMQSNGLPSPPVDVSNANAILNQAGLAYPDINDKLLNLYLTYLRESGFLPEPTMA